MSGSRGSEETRRAERRERKRRRKLRAQHLWERARYLAFRPRQHHTFYIVTAAYNVSEAIERTLTSVAEQRYPAGRIVHHVIDDASPDRTDEAARSWLARERPEHIVKVERNDSNVGGCANLTRGFRAAPDDAIVIQLDGDDWLPDRDVLGYLNMLYHDADLWMTYNSWRTPDGKTALHHHELPFDVVLRNRTRSHTWRTSHLHSFRARLFSHVRDESLIDPDTGTWWRYAVDQSHYLPMLELAGKHARHVPRVTYVYNLNDSSVLTTKRDEQLACERRIRALPPYQPLTTL